jgi:ubiquinone/menaquinone biosynthesis C-methylase UbiE
LGFYSDRVFPILLRRAVRHFAEDRAEIVSQAEGTVLEIGIGGGENLVHYTPAATRIVGIEPSPSLLRQAILNQQSAANGENLPGRFTYQVGSAESLPFRDHSFDSAVAFLVFCTIPNPQAAASEIFRVLRPGGRLLFCEHVRAKGGGMAWLQDHLNPLWKVFSLGCNLNRDTRSVFEGAGFHFEWLIEESHTRSLRPGLPLIKGAGVRPE